MVRHGTDHFRGDAIANREADENIRVLQGVGQRASRGLRGEARLVRIHVFLAALVDHAFGVAKEDVLATHTQANVVLRAGNAGGSCTIQDDANFAKVLAHDFHSVQQRRTRNDGRPVLIVVEDRNGHRLSQRLFNLEALRSFDVLQIDAPEGRLEKLANSYDLSGVLGIHLQIKDVDIGEAFE